MSVKPVRQFLAVRIAITLRVLLSTIGQTKRPKACEPTYFPPSTPQLYKSYTPPLRGGGAARARRRARTSARKKANAMNGAGCCALPLIAKGPEGTRAMTGTNRFADAVTAQARATRASCRPRRLNGRGRCTAQTGAHRRLCAGYRAACANAAASFKGVSQGGRLNPDQTTPGWRGACAGSFRAPCWRGWSWRCAGVRRLACRSARAPTRGRRAFRRR